MQAYPQSPNGGQQAQNNDFQIAQKQINNRPKSDHGEYEKKGQVENLNVTGDHSHQLKISFEGNSLELCFNPSGKGVHASIVYDKHNVFTCEGHGANHAVSNLCVHSG